MPGRGGSPVGPRAAALLVFATSGAVLVLELVALRLVAPYLGITLETNTAVIGVALAAIAVGAWAGGRFADLAPPERTLGPLILIAGALVAVIGPAVRWTGSVMSASGPTLVMLVAMAAMFAPAALLSAVTPMVTKLRLTSLSKTGTVVGRLSAIATAGAIAGTVLTGFVLVSVAPTSVILLGLAGVLVVTGVAVTIWLHQARAVVAPLVVALVAAGTTALAPRVCDVETTYHCARVITDPERPTGRILQLDTLRHSYVDVEDPTHLEFEYVRAIAAGIDAQIPGPLRALHLGGGGLTLPRYLVATRPASQHLVLEIDPGVLALDRAELGLELVEPGSESGIVARTVDARIGLGQQPDDSRDVVVGDAFGGVAVPWHLTTVEVVRGIERVLTDGGLYAANIIDHPPLAFVRAEVATISEVFEHVAIAAPPDSLAGTAGGNLVVLASDRRLDVDAIRADLEERDTGYELLTGPQVSDFVGDAPVLTDDFAPVDQLLTPYPPAASIR